MLVIVGCGANEQGGAETQPTQEASGEQPKEGNQQNNKQQASENQDVRVIEHAMGKTEITGTPKRIVTLYQGATDVAVALGVKPVGVVESWVEQPVYNYMKDDLEGVAIVGEETQPNLEEIAKLKPDLIIASKLRHEKIYDQLSQIAPTVTHETVFKFKHEFGMWITQTCG